MFGPGAYVPDPTEGIVDVKDLPAPQLVVYSRDHKYTPCPRCGHLAYRHKADQCTILDDKLLPATSNAVERGNRRHRKMQKSVYRIRSKVCLEGRIALDMIRESRAEGRDQTTEALHQARRGYP
jgi:hypothetical protein